MAYKRISPIPIAEGGTNTKSFATTDGVAYYDGTELTVTAVGTANQVLTSNGAGMAPTFQTNPIGAITEIDGEVGHVTGSTIDLLGAVAGGTVTFNGDNAHTMHLHASDGGGNTLWGVSTSSIISSGQNNSCFGGGSMTTLTTGSGNTAIGAAALQGISTQTNNVAVGFQALGSGNNGNQNVAVGAAAIATTSGNSNVAVGNKALNDVGTGSFNIGLGEYAGSAAVPGTTSSSNVYINYNTAAAVSESNKLRIGSSTGSGNQQLNAAYICGIDGVNVGSVAKVLTMASDQVGTASIAAGSGITITPSANTITVATTTSTVVWSVITADQSAVAGHGYICNKAGLLTLTLPASSVVGDVIEVSGMNTDLGWTIAQNAGQQIHYGTADTTAGATGSLSSLKKYDSVRIVCNVAGASAQWIVVSSIGTLTVA